MMCLGALLLVAALSSCPALSQVSRELQRPSDAVESQHREVARLRAEGKAREQEFVKAMWIAAPGCAAAWNRWISGIGVDASLLDYRDVSRYWAMRRACDAAFKALDRNGYGKAPKEKNRKLPAVPEHGPGKSNQGQ